MRISDWSSDVCSSDLGGIDIAVLAARLDECRQSRTEVVFAEISETALRARFVHERRCTKIHVCHICLSSAPQAISSNKVWPPSTIRVCPVMESEARRVGKECVGPCRSRLSP